MMALVASGQVRADDLVWRKPLANWVRADSIREFYPAPDVPPPLPPACKSAPTDEEIAFAEAVLAILRGHNSKNQLINQFHVAPNIPEKKLANARSVCAIPPTEEVLGLIDCPTPVLFGFGSYAVVFGAEALYYSHLQGNCEPNPGRVPYKDFPNRTFQNCWVFCIAVGVGEFFSVSGSSVPRPTVMSILNGIKALDGRGRATSLTPWRG